MKKLENAFKVFQYLCLSTFCIGVLIVVVGYTFRAAANESHRDYEYEAYCDSIWETDPDYYIDVLVETDEFQEYVAINGEWWKH